MTDKKIESLILGYNTACDKIVQAFCKKQGLEFDFWIADEVGTIASFSLSYFFKMEDIVHDIKTNQKAGLILDWHNDSTHYNFNLEIDKRVYVNYQSYCMGMRFSDISPK
jgi:hypothetical protein